jgi:hypothetical protein
MVGLPCFADHDFVVARTAREAWHPGEPTAPEDPRRSLAVTPVTTTIHDIAGLHGRDAAGTMLTFNGASAASNSANTRSK